MVVIYLRSKVKEFFIFIGNFVVIIGICFLCFGFIGIIIEGDGMGDFLKKFYLKKFKLFR